MPVFVIFYRTINKKHFVPLMRESGASFSKNYQHKAHDYKEKRKNNIYAQFNASNDNFTLTELRGQVTELFPE